VSARFRTARRTLSTSARPIEARQRTAQPRATEPSKWNKIEHRLFSYISIQWRGLPLMDYQTVVSLIGTTTTTTGLTVTARPDLDEYPTGVRVSDAEVARLALQPHATYPQWNYTLAPRARRH
jgi:Rhodopirellula transposase DDE domain